MPFYGLFSLDSQARSKLKGKCCQIPEFVYTVYAILGLLNECELSRCIHLYTKEGAFGLLK
jgi:hypothetical protein